MAKIDLPDPLYQSLKQLAESRNTSVEDLLIEQITRHQHIDQLFNIALDILCVTDTEGYFKYVNPALSTLLGYDEETLSTQPFFSFVHPDDIDRTQREMAKLLKGGIVHNFENRYRHKDGYYIWLSWFARADESRQLIYAIARDITRNRQLRNTLARSEQQLRALVTASPLGIVLVDREGIINVANPRIAEMFGYTTDELVGQHIEILVPERLQNVHQIYRKHYHEEPYTRAMGEGRDIIGKRKDGSEFPIEVSLSPIEIENSHIIVAYVQDITQRKQLEREKTRQEENLRLFYDVTTRPGLSMQERFNLVLKTVLDILNLDIGIISHIEGDIYTVIYTVAPPDTLSPGQTFETGNTYCDITIQEDNVIAIEHMKESSYQAHPCYAAFALECYIGAPIYIDDKPYGTINFSSPTPRTKRFTSTEITLVRLAAQWVSIALERELAYQRLENINEKLEQRVAERTAELQQARDELEQRVIERTAELRQANEDVKNFAYIVSHDLRAPLVNIKGFAAELRESLSIITDMMHDILPSLDDSQQQLLTMTIDEDVPEALDFIDSSVERMDYFINAVLQLSRLGRQAMTIEHIDVHNLVEELLETLQHQIESQNIQVILHPLPAVDADRSMVEQIFGNILNNAVKYFEEGRPATLEIGGEQRNEDTLYYIKDTGRGISEDDFAKVFAPFRRAGKQNTVGEGMGLAYVRTLVNRLGGRIWFESQLGQGTTFYWTVSNSLISELERVEQNERRT